MKYLLFAALASLLSLSLNAEEVVIYKKIDKNGKVIFSDKPFPGATKKVIKTNTNVISMPKSNQPTASSEGTDENEEDAEDFNYNILSIDSPKQDEAIRANDGSLYVIVAVNPQLQLNHSVRLYLDGVKVGQDQKVPYFSLSNIARGTHKLTASIIDDKTKQTIKSGNERMFHLLRASILNKRGN